MLNIAFCDDDKQFLSIFVPKVENTFRYYRTDVHCYKFENGDDLIRSFSKYEPYFDVVFLDINMPGKNGKDVAEELRILDKKFKLVFITAHLQEALNTFQYDVIGFLPKTMISERLNETVNLIIKRIQENDTKAQIFDAYRVDLKLKKTSEIIKVKVPIDDIIYFESINRAVFLHTKRETFRLHNVNFSTIVEKYLPFDFVDIYRTCIVNIKYIYSVDKFQVRLDNGLSLPLSRRKRSNVLAKLAVIVSGDGFNG